MQVCKGNLSSVSKNKLKTKSGLVFDLILWCVLIVRWNTFICFDSSLANFVCSLQYLSFYHLGPPPPPKIDMLAMQKNPPNNVVMWAHKDKTREVCTTILNHLASFIPPREFEDSEHDSQKVTEQYSLKMIYTCHDRTRGKSLMDPMSEIGEEFHNFGLR